MHKLQLVPSTRHTSRDQSDEDEQRIRHNVLLKQKRQFARKLLHEKPSEQHIVDIMLEVSNPFHDQGMSAAKFKKMFSRDVQQLIDQRSPNTLYNVKIVGMEGNLLCRGATIRITMQASTFTRPSLLVVT